MKYKVLNDGKNTKIFAKFRWMWIILHNQVIIKYYLNKILYDALYESEKFKFYTPQYYY